MPISSRERLLRTIAFEPTDYVPLSVLLWSSLWAHSSGPADYVGRQVALGIDPVVPMPRPAWKADPRVEVRIWQERTRPHPLLHKVYATPAGELHAVAAHTPDWPHGDDIPLLSDFNIPRSRKFLVEGMDDLEPLAFLLGEPGGADVAAFKEEAERRHALARGLGLATVSDPVRLVDTVCWLCGPVNMATWSIERPELLRELTALIAGHQHRLACVCRESGVDIRVRAEWYASPFLSPCLFERYFGAAIRRDVEMTHNAGALYCYVGTADMMPFLPPLAEMGVDVVYGLDPLEGRWDLAEAKAVCAGRMALWGGINGYLQVAHASAAEVKAAVAEALEALSPGGGFILSPVDDVGLSGTDQDTPETWARVWTNVAHMVRAWKALR
ncbi:MAG: hypothetical protein AMK73_00905 [Planctomycetes bacterium SM23_32]|nr:MAG: hypothetical protein AMK73_00905 [Planctomycetes bacterium SM23_32]